MKLKDLRTGMIIKTRIGELGMVLLDTKDGDIISGRTWCPINDTYDEDLNAWLLYKDGDEEEEELIRYDTDDIIEIYQPQSNQQYLFYGLALTQCDLIWKREE